MNRRRWVVVVPVVLLVLTALWPDLALLTVPALLFCILAYAVGFGTRRPSLAPTRSPDRSLLTDERRGRARSARRRRATLPTEPGTYGGALAAVVAATGLASLVAPAEELRAVLLLVAMLGVMVGLGRGSTVVRDVLYLGVGLAASAVTVAGLFGVGCAPLLPSRTATVLTLAPVAVMLATAVARGRLQGPGRTVVGELGVLALAAFALLELATTAVAPGGLPVLADTLAPSWAPVVFLMLLAIIGAGVGARPRAGADLVALGLLVITVTLLGLDTPCGLTLFALGSVTVSFVIGAVLGSVARRFVG